MINKSYLTGFINKFNFGKDLLENVEIEVNTKGNRVHCFAEDRSMYIDVHSKEFMFEKPFILPDIARFMKYLSVFDKEFEYSLNLDDVELDGVSYELKLFDDVSNFTYGLGEDVLLMNIKNNLPDSVPMGGEDILISIDEKKANAILNSLKLTSSYFITIRADKHNMSIQIGDSEIKEPVVEISLDGTINGDLIEEVSGRYSLNNFATILSVNKNCVIKVKFGKVKGAGMIIESEDDNYECIYAMNPLVR